MTRSEAPSLLPCLRRRHFGDQCTSSCPYGRSLGEFEGKTAGWNPPPRLGHLPGARHLEFIELFDPDDGTVKPAAALTALLGAKGITPEAAVVTY